MKNLVYGRNPVREVLRSGRAVRRLWLSTTLAAPVAEEFLALAGAANTPTERLSPDELTRLAGTAKHQGLVAEVEPFAYASTEGILHLAEQRREPALVVVLDGVEDPHNLGAIIRSAEAAGAHGVIIPRDRAVAVTPVVEKTAAGAASYLPIARVTNIARTMEELKKHGIWLFGASAEAPQEYTRADLTGPTGLVLGSEGKGLRRLTQEKCDFLVRIPMHGKVNSLNVSVAAGILLFEARRQRLARGNR
ncbi:MAG: 23S rRNA (guanosine(2251)-2'-O)-methyltransferase RlmB [candidate division KSB1 bacterium]|nr:23S rRNA (guanosine(2251)-2'-O)-methyltransferase RlmB [candidate division KSB1 bacterium]MDZ7295317.1 23S rRNA (guanosine(2251)-2'-O)-methyltransferase RlmB [candidate division KSB1 bacterium]